jgi:hypothetical protein
MSSTIFLSHKKKTALDFWWWAPFDYIKECRAEG